MPPTPDDEDPKALAAQVPRPSGERVPVDPHQAERAAAVERNDPRALADLVRER